MSYTTREEHLKKNQSEVRSSQDLMKSRNSSIAHLPVVMQGLECERQVRQGYPDRLEN